MPKNAFRGFGRLKMFTRRKEPCSLRRAMISNHQSSVRKFCSVFCAVVALAIELAAAPRGAYARVTTQFEALPLVRSRQNHLLVRAFINGKAAWLTVDSGAPVSAIASNRRDYFRLKPTAADSNLPARVQINGGFNKVAIARELRIGALILVDEPMVTVDLGGSSRAARLVHEQEIDGIIGADILFPTQAVLDCERQLLILNTDPSVLGRFPGFDRRGLRAVPIQVSDGYNLYVNGSVHHALAPFVRSANANCHSRNTVQLVGCESQRTRRARRAYSQTFRRLGGYFW